MRSRRPNAILVSSPEETGLEPALGVGVEDAIATLDVGLADGDTGGSSNLLVLG